jgi:hypothetical protein
MFGTTSISINQFLKNWVLPNGPSRLLEKKCSLDLVLWFGFWLLGGKSQSQKPNQTHSNTQYGPLWAKFKMDPMSQMIVGCGCGYTQVLY